MISKVISTTKEIVADENLSTGMKSKGLSKSERGKNLSTDHRLNCSVEKKKT